jgi:hypothetical protein
MLVKCQRSLVSCRKLAAQLPYGINLLVVTTLAFYLIVLPFLYVCGQSCPVSDASACLQQARPWCDEAS